MTLQYYSTWGKILLSNIIIDKSTKELLVFFETKNDEAVGQYCLEFCCDNGSSVLKDNEKAFE